MRHLVVHRAGPGATVQDLGRTGHLAQGLSRGGALDRLAIHEGAVLLGQSPQLAAVEMIGAGIQCEVTEPVRIALTGAPMEVHAGDRTLAWQASHLLLPGVRLTIGRPLAGRVGYLHFGGGIEVPLVLGGRATHLTAGLGAALAPGDVLPIGTDTGGRIGLGLAVADRFSGGILRLMPSIQTALFPAELRARFKAGTFRPDPRSNRMALRLMGEREGFGLSEGLSIVSEGIAPGDVQITGDGVPVILLAECQTTGGYPRIASVLPADLPKAVQTPAKAKLTFSFLSWKEACTAQEAADKAQAALPRRIKPLIRSPETIADLLRYRLVDGAVTGQEDEI
ncbi:MAG: biotin-dependent carboxyltransferase family protein [Rhodobacteraceae bacterium]|nr:biotin-dependent carboxyltransferase family protein [Paracoccaceae bacterium]